MGTGALFFDFFLDKGLPFLCHEVVGAGIGVRDEAAAIGDVVPVDHDEIVLREHTKNSTMTASRNIRILTASKHYSGTLDKARAIEGHKFIGGVIDGLHAVRVCHTSWNV